MTTQTDGLKNRYSEDCQPEISILNPLPNKFAHLKMHNSLPTG